MAKQQQTTALHDFFNLTISNPIVTSVSRVIDCPLPLKVQKKVNCWVSVQTSHILMLWVGGQYEVPNQTVNIWWVKKTKQGMTIWQVRKPTRLDKLDLGSQRQSWSLVWVYKIQTSFYSSLNKDMLRFKIVKSKIENQMSKLQKRKKENNKVSDQNVSSLLLYPQPGSFSRLRVYICFTNSNSSQIHISCFRLTSQFVEFRKQHVTLCLPVLLDSVSFICSAQPDTDNHSFLLLWFQQPSAGAEKLYVPVCTQEHYLATLSYRVESLQHL